VLQTNTQLPAAEVALKYKELWQVEHAFRDVKTVFETRPVYHKMDETIRGHVFCSILALVLKKELDKRLSQQNLDLEWEDIKRDLSALREVTLEEGSSRIVIRTVSRGVCSNVCKAVGVALPPAIRTL
jgi:transposase